MEGFSEFSKEFKELSQKYGLNLRGECVLELGKKIAYMQEGYVKKCYRLHFEQIVPATEEELKDVTEVQFRELNVVDFM